MKNRALGLIINILSVALLTYFSIFAGAFSFVFIIACSAFIASRSYNGKAWETAVELIVSATVIAVTSVHSIFSVDGICSVLSTFCLSAFGGAIIGLLARHKCSFRTVITGGTTVYLASFIIDFANLRLYHNMDLSEEFINKPVENIFHSYKQIITASNLEGTQNVVAAFDDIQQHLQKAMAAVMPSMLIILCLFLTYITFLIFRKLIFLCDKQVIEGYPHFWQLQPSKGFTLTLSLLFILTFFMKTSNLNGALINIIIILCALHFICGLSMVDFFFRKTGVPWFLRCIVYAVGFVVLSFIGMILPIINVYSTLMVAGIADTMSDFRKLRGDRHEA